jgi:hypothetical protein
MTADERPEVCMSACVGTACLPSVLGEAEALSVHARLVAVDPRVVVG